MKRPTPHIVPAISAIILTIGFLVGFEIYATRTEDRYVHALAPRLLIQARLGIALQHAAFQYPDLLTVYGSSEMRKPETKYRATEFFQSYPTGFMVMDLADAGVTSLITAQNLAAIGPDLNGKKVVISFTPSMFEAPEAKELPYHSNFSQLNADEFVFSPYLSAKLKQLIAERMLAYPATLEEAPLLNFELENLAQNSPLSIALYYASWPLGKMETTALELKDHAAVMDYLQSRKTPPRPVRRAVTINWTQEIRNAQADQIVHSANNSYGVETGNWPYYENILDGDPRPGSRDWQFIGGLRNSAEWTDLDLMLQVLKELGAKPLIMSRPFNGPLLNAMGISTNAQNLFYDKLKAAVAPYQFTLVEFRQHTRDPFFSQDQSSHTSRKGWVYIDQTLDLFYHDRFR